MAVGETAKLIASLELQDKFSKPAKNAEGALGRLEARTSTLGRIGNEAGRGLGNAANNIRTIGTMAGGVAVVGIVAATKAAIDFEDAFAGIEKTVDEADLKAAGLTFGDLSDSIRKMAREIPVAATELAGIGEAAGALGIRAQDIESFTAVVAKLSVTTDLTSEAASTALGQLGNVLHLTGSDFEDFADSLVALGNAGASTESQIVEMAARFGAAGNSAGLSKEEILALSSAVASMGIDVEAGGSALSRVFNNVATNIGTSNSKAKEFAKAMGLSAAEFKKSWDRDALGTFQEFLKELNTLDQFEAASLLKKVGITNTRDVAAVRLMAQNVSFLNDQLKISESATGALGEEAAKKFATTASQIQLMKNRLTDVGITIGSAVLPKINELGKRFGDFLNTPEAQAAIEKFAAGLPAVIDDLVGIAKGVPWAAIGSAAQLMGTGAKALLQAFTSLPPWVQTAVLTGWGLNKLTGGALGNIAGMLGKAAIGNLRGTTPANPLFVSDVTGGGGGLPGVGGAAGGGIRGAINGGGLIGGLATGVAAASPVLAGIAAVEVVNFENMRTESRENLQAILDELPRTPAQIEESIDRLQGQIDEERPLLDGILFNTNVKPQLEEQITTLRQTQAAQLHAAQTGYTSLATEARAAKNSTINEFRQASNARRNEANRTASLTARVAERVAEARRATQTGFGATAERLGTSNARLATIAGKNFSPTVRVNVTSNVSISEVQRKIISSQIAIGRGFLEGTG